MSDRSEPALPTGSEIPWTPDRLAQREPAFGVAVHNVEVSPEDPVETWPYQAVQIALERGSLTHWRRLAAAIRDDPWGPVARAVERVLLYSRPYGVALVMEDVLAGARRAVEAEERAEVAAEVRRLLGSSGLTRDEFARGSGHPRPDCPPTLPAGWCPRQHCWCACVVWPTALAPRRRRGDSASWPTR